MTISFFAKMLNPELDIIIYKDKTPISKTKAARADESKYSKTEIKDWRMCTSRPMARVDI